MKKRRIISIVIILVFFLIRMQNESINRQYSNMKKDLIEYKSANICIISKTEHEGIVGYSVGASSIIFKKDENGYYALTANHVVNKENTEFLIMTVNDPTLLEYRKNHPDVEIVSNNKYYDQFPTAEVVNENMELVGVNIGGQKNIFGGFSCGVMIPCEQINKCIVMSGLTFE